MISDFSLDYKKYNEKNLKKFKNFLTRRYIANYNYENAEVAKW